MKKGIHEKFLRWVEVILRETWNVVITKEGISKGSRTYLGVKQGCKMDEIWEKRNVGGTVIGKLIITEWRLCSCLFILS